MLKRNRDCLDGTPGDHQAFLDVLEEKFKSRDVREGQVVPGRIVGIDGGYAVVDVGLKMEGRVPLQEFSQEDPPVDPEIGSPVEVYLERIEGASNGAVLSREKARREQTWVDLERAFERGESVTGEMFSRMRGGFMVNLGGVVAFLPSSHVDMHPVNSVDVRNIMHVPQDFEILKMNRRRRNIVVSRRSVLEKKRAKQKTEIIKNLREGQIFEGVIKGITPYGVFVDLGGIDGLLHVTDISWTRISHPRDALKPGETIRVQIIKIDPQTGRVSLGMKQLQEDPWATVANRYTVGQRVKGRVTNIQDYGAFVELEPGVEGLVHVSEMSWTRKNVVPAKIMSTSQEVEVVVLKIEPKGRRISLGYKQCQANPWQAFSDNYPIGSVVEGRVENVTSYCLFVSVDGGIDAMLHFSDLDWVIPGDEAAKNYAKGQIIRAKVLSIDPKEERVSLGIKQLTEPPEGYKGSASSKPQDPAERPPRKGETVTCVVAAIQDSGIQVRIVEKDWAGFIRKSDLSRSRFEQRPDRFGVGDYVDAVVMSVDRSARKSQLSIKEREIQEERRAVASYGSQNSGALLGDILGLALKPRNTSEAEPSEGGDAAGEKK